MIVTLFAAVGATAIIMAICYGVAALIVKVFPR